MKKIEIYTNKNDETSIEVNFENETVWLNQKQMTELFQRDRTVITKHINNIFKEEELDRKSNVQKMHITNSDKPVEFYNLDVIISVGYRVKSKQGTQFRRWATNLLKDYLIQGYAVNQKRLDQLQKTIELVSNNADANNLDEAKGLLEIIKNYNKSFILLNQFDSNSLKTEKLNENITYEIKHNEALKSIDELKRQLISKKEATELFGNQKDNAFQGILGNIIQSFGGEYLYKSIEEQAANLLYFIIKNHSFSDGNKRIGAFMFIWFLEKNKHTLKKNGELKINDNALIALALLIASSNPSEKDLMVNLVINLIKDQ
ncbi:MAG: death-on-curing family protein [Rickettsiales bacterium]|jgi:death-on-curing family protein